jgi:catechol 2,3-dioxygenase-like lactoylglutathione lyase family enzyme
VARARAYIMGMTEKHALDAPPSPPFRPMPLTRILETALYVDDLVKAREFYADVLGLEILTEVEGRHVFFRLEGAMLLLFDPIAAGEAPEAPPAPQVPPHGASGPGHVCFALRRDALDGWRDALSAAGVAIESEVIWPNGARSLYFRDPSGNSLELAEPGLWFTD